MNAVSKIQPSLIGALAKALPEIGSVSKNKENPAFKAGGKVSKYADLPAIIDALEPIRAYGLWFRQVAREHDAGAAIETFYVHESGEELSAGVTFMPTSKRDAQGFGSALTYCRRYALQTAFGLATEDDDGNSAPKPDKVEARQAEPTIGHEQTSELILLMQGAQLTPAKFNQTFAVKDVQHLPASRFDEAKERLNARMAELAKQATNEKAKVDA